LSMSVLMAKPNNNGTLACRPSQAAGPSPAMSGFRSCRLPLGVRLGLSRPPERLADLVSDRGPAGSHIPQFTIVPRGEFSP
jgi:hypothetical protein